MYVVRRSKNNPLLSPRSNTPWEARGTFNGSPIKKGNTTYLLYRAIGRPDALMSPGGLSTIGLALSTDGEKFHSHQQFITPEQPWEKYGCEDPRVTYFEGTYVIFYTALGGTPFSHENIKVGVALSKDLKKIDEKHLVTPFNAKAMVLFPERINGKVTALLTVHTDMPPAKIALVQCDNLEDLWSEAFWKKWYANLESHIIDPLRHSNDHVETGAVPIKTKEGWLVIYSYIQNYFGGGQRVFGIEAILLGATDLKSIVGRTRGPILVPEETYEHFGMVPHIVFPSGALVEKNRLDIYYGGADTVCAKASLHLPDLLQAMTDLSRERLLIREKTNPILTPNPANEWEKQAVFNAAAIELEGVIHILYRAMSDDNTSVIGHATTKNGVKIVSRDPIPAYMPREEFEQKKAVNNSGCEDPRLTLIGNTIYMAYTAFDGVHAPRAALTSISVKDFIAGNFTKWTKPELVTPENYDDKDMCLLPEKVGKNYMFIHRISPQICADLLPTLDFKKNRINRCIEMMGPRPGSWDSLKIGLAGTPIKTDKGWVLIYHGVSATMTYRLGAVLLDLQDPTVVISRTVDPILEPKEQYEKEGVVPKVVFSCGGVLRNDTLFVYYGGADKVIGVAKLSMKKLLKILLPDSLS
ncbi:hypothetical protein K2Q08_03645 [Patescibacteria group bacterium]|nr:hypothetical protein [Patescibacteria group bacterium]